MKGDLILLIIMLIIIGNIMDILYSKEFIIVSILLLLLSRINLKSRK